MQATFSFHDAVTLFQAPFWGGMGIALLSGPLGALLVWQRLAYLGDALAHASLLGVGFSLLFVWPLLPTALAFTVSLAFLLFFFLHSPSQRQVSSESLLLLLAQGFMGIGLVLMTCTHLSAVDLMAYFVGDFLTLDWADVLLIWGVALGFGIFLYRFWSPLLILVIHPELAATQGIAVRSLRLVFLLFTSVILVLTVQTVGVLLVTALLVFPILTLHPWVSTPEKLCVSTSFLGFLGVWGGLFLSLCWDVPPGPLITVLLFCCFGLSQVIWHLHKTLVPSLKN